MLTVGRVKSVGPQYGFVHEAQSGLSKHHGQDFYFMNSWLKRRFLWADQQVVFWPYRIGRDKWRAKFVLPLRIAKLFFAAMVLGVAMFVI